MNLSKSLAVGALAVVATSLLTVAPARAATTTRIVRYPNCTRLNAVYPHGVGRKGAHDQVRGHTKPVTRFVVNTALYTANRSLDRDGDGVACEKR